MDDAQCEHGITLAPLLTEVRRARQFARFVLQKRHIAPDRIETAELLASELVSNAVKAACGTMLRPVHNNDRGHARSISLRLRLVARFVAIEVRDSSDRLPVLQEQCPDSEDGRGLLVVDSMSTRWDYSRLSSGGKVVWCVLDVARQVSADDVVVRLSSLPRRRRRSLRPARQIEIMRDPELLRRVRDGLLALGDGEQPGQLGQTQ
jgi:anti-sigma regulatory factor (Ser/Thr protein kinase)